MRRKYDLVYYFLITFMFIPIVLSCLFICGIICIAFYPTFPTHDSNQILFSNDSIDIPVHAAAVNIISDAKTNIAIGTGFILGNPPFVVTCVHVIENREILNYSLTSEIEGPSKTIQSVTLSTEIIQIKPIKIFPEQDIAVLIPMDRDISHVNPFQISEMSLETESEAFLIGWHFEDSGLPVIRISPATFLNEIKEEVVTKLAFHGSAKPGYSGSPVLDKFGKVLGIVESANLEDNDGHRVFFANKLDVLLQYISDNKLKDN